MRFLLRIVNLVVFLTLVVAVFVSMTSGQPQKERPFGIVIHGGAGTMRRENMTPEREKAYREKLSEAITKGYTILKNGGTSLDAAEATLRILEDSPLFNAGKGAVFTSEGTNELDASIMDGATLKAGAVAGLKRIKNPISLARLVMDKSPHVMMVGEGAEAFAKQQGVEFVDPSYFKTEERWKQLEAAKKREEEAKGQKSKSNLYDESTLLDDHKFGTVGCAALDKAGNLAAATTTGGTTNKKFGRVGDSPIIGAGTYANNKTCAVSATGTGEYFIRAVVAHDISALMEYKGMTLKDAADEVVMNKLVKMGGDGGVIAIDKDGNIAMPFNTSGMYRAYVDEKGNAVVKIYKEEIER